VTFLDRFKARFFPEPSPLALAKTQLKGARLALLDEQADLDRCMARLTYQVNRIHRLEHYIEHHQDDGARKNVPEIDTGMFMGMPSHLTSLKGPLQ
jgi:hypothetical protein